MVISVDVAYLISMTSFDGEVGRIDLHYDGSQQLKGVMGGALYPIFWINMSGENSLAVKEDRLKLHGISNMQDVKEYCDAFYLEYSSFTFRPFIKGDVGQTMAKVPSWYDDYHASLVKNFNLPDNEYNNDPVEEDVNPQSNSDNDFGDMQEILQDIVPFQQEAQKELFSSGQRVSHPKFGMGTVLMVDGNKVTVLFDNVGTKRVMDAFLKA